MAQDKGHSMDFSGLELECDSIEIGGTAVTATAAEINAACDVSARFVAAGGTLTVTQASHDGKIIKLDTAAGSVCTLPAATGSGAVYTFMVTTLATSNSHIVKVADAATTIDGMAWLVDTDTAGTTTGFATAATSDTITLNRSTTGSVTLGEKIIVTDTAANQFSVLCFLSNTGNGATPFSATVA